MKYENDIPDYAFIPAGSGKTAAEGSKDIRKDIKREIREAFERELESELGAAAENDGFDPSPYDRLLGIRHAGQDYKEQLKTFEGSMKMPEGAAGQPAEASDIPAMPPETEEPSEVSSDEAMEAFTEFSPVEKTEDFPAISPAETEHFQGLPESTEIAAPQKPTSVKLTPMGSSAIYSELKATEVKERPHLKVQVEEDVLVPDIRPDLSKILLMDAAVKLAGRENRIGQKGEDFLKITGEIMLHTMYIPEERTEEPIVEIRTRIPFRTDWDISISPLSGIALTPVIDEVAYTVINERKFRAQISLHLEMREYADIDMQLFEGVRGDNMQILKKRLSVTGVASRISDTKEISEVLMLKDSHPTPEKILKCDLNVVENHKQITSEKAVISATVYYRVLYLAEDGILEETLHDGNGEDVSRSFQRNRLSPHLYQGRTEFTQFIPLSGLENPVGSRISFRSDSLALTVSPEEPRALTLSGNVETSLEIYEGTQRDVVCDIYHGSRDITYEQTEISTTSLAGSGITEASVREIVNIPDKYGEIERIVYITGRIKGSESVLDHNRNTIEGIIEVTCICIPKITAGETAVPYTITQELPFRSAMEIAGTEADMNADNAVVIKEIWSDKINDRQIEVNVGLSVTSSVFRQENHRLIKNLCFAERPESSERAPVIVIYVTRQGDDLWQIAKRYRTTMEDIKAVNELATESLTPGTKLLIVR